ncbi:helix-turn-helix transcriptional regulator [Haematospirillum jordaniae]|uniref:Peptidase S24/S26A/S26B/S26C domain-containing protein n=1 Tax=Haematospirillum jordaniae TaxID=1549855 RepID=A0A143DDE4_9PROT|nr:S24 family peptidase [Haematospirillum jordaniae]AMW34737.1 hypothetical protein AY555_05575 [Haematospirillum jordaniae]NKD45524.1 helix-turn-helix transcriptional regulator [Haematospirillum jordaniae]NKD56909.1 helix-turn-helix transcriptional regulator [Haematospirillum jordaniae]NKD58935.1 helix-turn-helix transcriptional regulator [Haematospirillum jordaniae]NKD66834.1 helix-turn-helix transcriptional regulator [Haematospirillum jordaniae]
MLTHHALWTALDRLAEDHGLSPSALAKKAGLDPTTFNPSKRFGRDGKPRWPTTESLSKVLQATDTRPEHFLQQAAEAMAEPPPPPQPILPLVSQDQARNGLDAAGNTPNGTQDAIAFPDLRDPDAWALEIHGDACLPAYRDGDRLILSPNATARRGDRVVIYTRDKSLVMGELTRTTATRMVVQPFGAGSTDQAIDQTDIAWSARILWASQ